MSQKRAPARTVAKRQSKGGYWIDHAEIVEDDLEWLAKGERLTLWNVHVPRGFLAQLDKLWWLDLRGGSAADVAVARGANKLRYLAVNQVRGLSDLSVVSELTNLRYLGFYGLPKVTHLPSCAALSRLERAELGQMRGLVTLAGLLEAPNLRELQFARKINVTDDDVDGIVNHPTIERFGWFAEDVPVETWVPVVERIGLPEVSYIHPEKWFSLE